MKSFQNLLSTRIIFDIKSLATKILDKVGTSDTYILPRIIIINSMYHFVSIKIDRMTFAISYSFIWTLPYRRGSILRRIPFGTISLTVHIVTVSSPNYRHMIHCHYSSCHIHIDLPFSSNHYQSYISISDTQKWVRDDYSRGLIPQR